MSHSIDDVVIIEGCALARLKRSITSIGDVFKLITEARRLKDNGY